MAEAVYHNNSRDLFFEVRKMHTGKRSQPLGVDGKADDNGTCQVFSDKYDKPYNSVPRKADIFQKIKDKIDQKVCNNICCAYYATVHDVINAVIYLKLRKSDGEEGLLF